MFPLKAEAVRRLKRSSRAALAAGLGLLAVQLIALGFVERARGRNFAAALLYAVPVAVTAGFVAAVYVFSRLTDEALREHRKALEEHRISMAKSDVLSLVSHQFSNALTVMGLAVGLLETPPENAGPGHRQELYRTLKQNMRTLSLIAQNFLNQARLESGHFALERQSVDIGELIRNVLSTLQPLSQQKQIAVACDIPGGNPRVLADPDALNVVLTNLVGNAVKYTAAEGRILISVGEAGSPGGGFRVTVEDTGLGIAKKDQQRILSGFVRTASGKKAAAGYGLGLKVVHDMLRSHGSRLLIESEAGKGSRFTFTLPGEARP